MSCQVGLLRDELARLEMELRKKEERNDYLREQKEEEVISIRSVSDHLSRSTYMYYCTVSISVLKQKDFLLVMFIQLGFLITRGCEMEHTQNVVLLLVQAPLYQLCENW